MRFEIKNYKKRYNEPGRTTYKEINSLEALLKIVYEHSCDIIITTTIHDDGTRQIILYNTCLE
jgi:hypothetical protein